MSNFSIRSLMLLTVYVSTCGSIYITPNSAAGWAVVIATAMLIVASTIQAFRNDDAFALGFSVFATLAILTCFGFSFDSSRNFKGWKFQSTVFRVMRFGKPQPELLSFGDPKNIRLSQHSFFRTDNVMRSPDDDSTPTFRNAMNLFACAVAVTTGLAGGVLFLAIVKPRA